LEDLLLENRVFSGEGAATLKLVLPIIIIADGAMSVGSLFSIVFAIGCLKPTYFVFIAVSFSPPFIPKPGGNCPSFPPPFQ